MALIIKIIITIIIIIIIIRVLKNALTVKRLFISFARRGIYMTAERAVMLVKKVSYLGEFGFLNSSCFSLLAPFRGR